MATSRSTSSSISKDSRKAPFISREALARVGAIVGMVAVGATVIYSYGPVNKFIDRWHGYTAVAAAAPQTIENKPVRQLSTDDMELLQAGRAEATVEPDVFYVHYHLEHGQSLSYPANQFAFGEDPLAAAQKIMDYIPGMTEADKANYNVHPGEISFALDINQHEVVPFDKAPARLGSVNGN
jgi:ABC-type amino acid transport substrate-binding protein